MAEAKFKYIRAGYQEGMPAHINFYDDVDYWSVNDFIYEFHYLEKYVSPSKIVIHINSAGGCVVDGISVFSIIQNSEVPTETMNDGLAASMGSIIWAAGDSMYMKDYALLMIHNPFSETKDKSNEDAIEAFKKQLGTIYSKRFGMTDEQVKKIMDGEDGKDGTWFTAEEAVSAGFISQDHIIETPEAVKNAVAAKAFGVRDLKNLVNIMASVKDNVEHNVQNNNNLNNSNNKMEKDFTLVAAYLKMDSSKATENAISARINELLDHESELETVKSKLVNVEKDLQDAKTKLSGSETSVKNLTASLDDAKKKLKVFEDAEAAAKAKAIEDLVDGAINVCKISKDDRATWIEQANANFDLTKKCLDAIPARDDINAELHKDPENKHNAAEGMKSEEEKAHAKVMEVVGSDFKYNKWKN